MIESATDTVSSISLGVGSTNHSMHKHDHDHNAYEFYLQTSLENKSKAGLFITFFQPKQQLISTESTEKPSEGTQKADKKIDHHGSQFDPS